MTLQKPRPGESLPADVALVVETVSQDVHGEGGHADVHLPAHQALLGCARAQTQVGLLVSEHQIVNIKYQYFFLILYSSSSRHYLPHVHPSKILYVSIYLSI